MTQCGNLVGNIAAAADGTGVGGVTAGGAGGSGDNTLVVVTQSIRLIRNILVAAGGAGIGGIAAVGAIGIGNDTLIFVTQSLALGLAAGSAGLGGSTGGIHPAVLMHGADAVDVELSHSNPAVIGLFCHKLHIANSLDGEADILLAGICLEGHMLRSGDPLVTLMLPDIEAGLGDLTAVVSILAGQEGELVDDIGLTEVDDAGEGVGAVQLVAGALPVGMPVGTGLVVPGVFEQAFLGIVNGLRVHGNLLPQAPQLAEGIGLLGRNLNHLVQVELGAVAAPAADAAGIAQIVAILVGSQALDGPAIIAMVNQLKNVAGLIHIGGIALNVQVASGIFQLVAAFRSLKSPEILSLCEISAGSGSQGVGTPGAASLLVGQRVFRAMQADHIGCIGFHLCDLLGDLQVSLLLCMGMTHGHQTDDHDQRQQKAQKTFQIVFHGFPFFLSFFDQVLLFPHPGSLHGIRLLYFPGFSLHRSRSSYGMPLELCSSWYAVHSRIHFQFYFTTNPLYCQCNFCAK